MTIKDPNPNDGVGPIVTGADVTQSLNDKTTRYSGSNIRFRMIGGAFAVTVFGICYVNWLLGHGFWLRDLPFGKQWVLLLIWVTWLGETAAYLVGSTVGRRPLAPVISPQKTIEGAVAQFCVSVVAAVVGQAWFFAALPREHAVAVGVLLGVVGQVGDLVESALKRSVGTKDTGHLIPGHGGILDRVDSLLFNTPVLFYYASHGRILTS